MTTIQIQDLRDELSQFLRYSDVLSTSVRGVTRTVGAYVVGLGGEATHSFAATIPVRDFKFITVNAVNYYWLRNYTINWTTGLLTWNVPLLAGDSVAFSVDWGSGDKIFPDLPRDDLSLTSFPRVGIELTSFATEPLGLGGANHISDIVVTIIVWVSVNKDAAVAGGFGGMTDLENTMTSIRSVIRAAAKTFFTFNWIYPKGTNPVTRSTNNKVMQHSQDFMIRFRVE